MLIVLIDDELSLRETVGEALSELGHEVFKLDTSNAALLRSQLDDFVSRGRSPDLVILDGHNILRDLDGNALFDMTPLGIMTWLQQYGFSPEVRFILYSNDEELVETVLKNRRLLFWRAIPKLGEGGGLKALLRSVQEASREKSSQI